MKTYEEAIAASVAIMMGTVFSSSTSVFTTSACTVLAAVYEKEAEEVCKDFYAHRDAEEDRLRKERKAAHKAYQQGLNEQRRLANLLKRSVTISRDCYTSL